jgi:hypothetical protein
MTIEYFVILLELVVIVPHALRSVCSDQAEHGAGTGGPSHTVPTAATSSVRCNRPSMISCSRTLRTRGRSGGCVRWSCFPQLRQHGNSSKSAIRMPSRGDRCGRFRCPQRPQRTRNDFQNMALMCVLLSETTPWGGRENTSHHHVSPRSGLSENPE